MIRIKTGSTNATAFKHISTTKRKLIGGIHSALLNIGRDNVREARAAMRRRKTGIVYRLMINGRRINHRASAPYESPAYLTGEMSRGYKYDVSGSSFLEWGNEAEYSGHLEFGAPRANLLPRPHILPVVEKHSGRVMNYLFNAFPK